MKQEKCQDLNDNDPQFQLRQLTLLTLSPSHYRFASSFILIEGCLIHCYSSTSNQTLRMIFDACFISKHSLTCENIYDSDSCQFEIYNLFHCVSVWSYVITVSIVPNLSFGQRMLRLWVSAMKIVLVRWHYMIYARSIWKV